MDMIDKAGRIKDGRYAYIAPLRNQAKSVAWDMLKSFSRPILGKPPNEAELYVNIFGGSRITLFGADNPDALRGQAFNGVVLDEYGDMNPTLFGSVVRPALADRSGFAVIVGTIKGRNQLWRQYENAVKDPGWFTAFLKASETGILSQEELSDAAKIMAPEQFSAEFECDPYAAIQGAYYGKALNEAESAGRFTEVPYEPDLPVETSWDLGIGDSTAIWFWQAVGVEIRIIDYFEDHGKALPHYVAVLNAKGYRYGKDFVPHDARVRELGTGKTRVETLAALGRNPALVANHKIMDGINAARQMLPRCWFDAEKCAEGIEALRQYQTLWDDNKRCFVDTPRHDWTSHCADSFRYMAMAFKSQRIDQPLPKPEQKEEITSADGFSYTVLTFQPEDLSYDDYFRSQRKKRKERA
jgi:phage terminase large subunit